MLKIITTAVLGAVLAQTVPSFEVASVKPNLSNDIIDSVQLQAGGGVRMTGFRLITLIVAAYESGTIQTRQQVIGGPSWIFTERFDIVAKADGDLGFDAEGRRPTRGLAMVRKLIEDRFAVRVHMDTRQLPAFAMRMSARDRKPGPNLKESKSECPKYAPGTPPPSVADSDRWCGFRRAGSVINAKYVTMAEVASYFASVPVVSRPLVDRTGLNGRYDLSLDYSENPEDAGALFTAFREQLGIRFDREQAILPVIVIDRAEHPTPD